MMKIQMFGRRPFRMQGSSTDTINIRTWAFYGLLRKVLQHSMDPRAAFLIQRRRQDFTRCV